MLAVTLVKINTQNNQDVYFNWRKQLLTELLMGLNNTV